MKLPGNRSLPCELETLYIYIVQHVVIACEIVR